MAEPTLQEKLDNAMAILRELKSVAVAFSAGVDSTLVLKLARDALGPDKVVAVTGKSDSLAAAEFEHAKTLAAQLGVEHIALETDEFENPAYLQNPTNRCYFCKTTLYTHLHRFIETRGIQAIVNGTNADDLGDYRPGLKAAGEHGVRAPAAEAGLTKGDVRAISKQLGLPNFDKPASPCLSSRIQYGDPITPEKLRRVEAAERFLREQMQLRDCRVRMHGDLARIEVDAADLAGLAEPENARRIDETFRNLGFRYVTLDLRGFRSGSMNEVIPLDSLVRG